MLDEIILAIVLAVAGSILLELVKRPFRSTLAWARKWVRLVRQLARLEQAVQNIASLIAHDEADYGRTEEEHQRAIQGLHDLTGRQDGDGLPRKPRSPFGQPLNRGSVALESARREPHVVRSAQNC